jgi:vancomycin permeability regulator SanA
MLRFLRVFAILLATAVACVAIVYFSIPMADTQQDHFDVILVLGNPARADGSIAPTAQSRVLEAIRQYRAGVAPRLLMTGGAVANQYVEAQVMLHFAESQGGQFSHPPAPGQLDL